MNIADLKSGMNFQPRSIAKILTGFVVLLLVFSTFVIVPAGHRGVVLTFGAVSGKVFEEGLHVIIPIAQTVQIIEVRTVKLSANATAYSKDLQTVDTEIALNYHVDPVEVNTLYQEVGADYEGRIIQPAIQESIKEVSANYTAQELIEERAKVKDEITKTLASRLSSKYLKLDEFSITNFSFSEAYEKAVEEKQVAQQNALKAENDLKRIQVEATQRVAQATAEAEAIKIQAQAITQQGGKEYVSLKWVEKWDGKLPTTSLGGSATPLINIPS